MPISQLILSLTRVANVDYDSDMGWQLGGLTGVSEEIFSLCDTDVHFTFFSTLSLISHEIDISVCFSS